MKIATTAALMLFVALALGGEITIGTQKVQSTRPSTVPATAPASGDLRRMIRDFAARVKSVEAENVTLKDRLLALQKENAELKARLEQIEAAKPRSLKAGMTIEEVTALLGRDGSAVSEDGDYKLYQWTFGSVGVDGGRVVSSTNTYFFIWFDKDSKVVSWEKKTQAMPTRSPRLDERRH